MLVLLGRIVARLLGGVVGRDEDTLGVRVRRDFVLEELGVAERVLGFDRDSK